MAQARPRVKNSLLSIPNDKWRYTIDNFIKSEQDREIAKLYYLDGWAQQDIAEEFNYSRSTIKHKIKKLLDIIEKNI